MKPEIQATAAEAKKPSTEQRSPASPAESHDDAVRLMAYQLFVERGHVHGHEVEDWLRAEALVSQQAAASTPAAKKAPKAAAKPAPAPAAAKKAAAPAAAKKAAAPAAAKKAAAPAAKRAPVKPRGE